MKQEIEYRYYEMPTGQYILPKYGEGWRMAYGTGEINKLHFHNYLEVGYCNEGYGKLVIKDKTYDYEKGMFTIVPANIPHTTENPDGNVSFWEYMFVDIESFLKTEMGTSKLNIKDTLSTVNKSGFLLKVDENADMAELITLMINECKAKDRYSSEALAGFLRAFTVDLIRLARENDTLIKNEPMSNYVAVAIKYIEAHFAENVKVSDIAKECGLSESHFRRTFEQSTNIRPLDYLNMVRVDKACELLYKKDLSMDEVGKQAGFETTSSFNRNFKRLTGKSPLQWKHSADSGMKNYHINIKKGWDF